MTYNDSNIAYGSNKELAFHGAVIGAVVVALFAVAKFVPWQEMPNVKNLEISEFTEFQELRTAEAAALGATADNGDGSYTIPIDAAMAALVADPALLDSAFDFEATAVVAADGGEPDPAAIGARLYEEKTCFTCHTVDGEKGLGPTFKGLFGRDEQLEDGSTVAVDELYLRESITNPGAKIVKGYAPAMPQLPLSEEELGQLVAYIQSLQ